MGSQKSTAATACQDAERANNEGAEEIPANPTCHGAENAADSVNGFFNTRNPDAAVGLVLAVWLRRAAGSLRDCMDAKSRLVLAMLMSSVMALMVTLVATMLNLGLRPDFVLLWLKAYAVAWPIAAVTAFFVLPAARRLTERIVGRLDGRR